MGKQRPAYPNDYYNILRKKANFGCAKCGVPLVNIHHIEGYLDKHKLEELILLCRDHHEDADSEKITKEELYRLKKNPYNSEKVHHAFNIPVSENVVIHIGGNECINVHIPLQLYGESIISTRLEEGQFLLSARFRDKDDNLRLEIRENIWESDTELVDLRYSENAAGTCVASYQND